MIDNPDIHMNQTLPLHLNMIVILQHPVTSIFFSKLVQFQSSNRNTRENNGVLSKDW